MNEIQAKNRILSLYNDGGISYKNVSLDEYKQLFYAIYQLRVSGNRGIVPALGEFYVHGTMAFNRFCGLRPQYVDEERYSMYCKFLNALQKLDGKFYGRTYFFHLEKIKWNIFRVCHLMPYDESLEKFLKTCEREIDTLLLPQSDERIATNLKKKKAEVLEFINDIRNGAVYTRIHTTLPYALTDSRTTIRLNIEGVKVCVTISNHSQGSSLPGINIAEGSSLTTSGPTKWTTTTCELEIVADCLIDGLVQVANVTLSEKEDDRFWTAPFDFTLRVIMKMWIFLQQQNQGVSSWPPSPNDIHYIHYRVGTDKTEYDMEYSTNTALVYHVKSLTKKPQQYDINEDKSNWSIYAYHFAKAFAESGQLNEAIFWLNVSVEALVEEFVQRTATTPAIRAEIEGNTHKFDTAEEILSKQFPEMKGRVKWPDTVIYTSVFTKLKRAIRLSDKQNKEKEILKNFSRINAKRNILFHGNSVNICVDDVEKAFKAYDWLKENL